MKKVLATLLILVLILCVNAAAFAQEAAPTQTAAPGWTDAVEVTLVKAYKLIGAGSSPAETFTLRQVGDGTVKTGEATSAPALGDITGAAFAEGAAAEDAAANITIALPTYTNVGVYEYILEEAAGATAGVDYYDGDIRLVVTVINGVDGKLRIAAIHVEECGEDKKITGIANTYSAGELNVTKAVTGILGDKEKEFAFTVTFAAPEGLDWENAIVIPEGNGASNLEQEGCTYTFTLSDGDSVCFENIPYGVTYTVSEEAVEDYETTSEGAEGTICAPEQTAAFTNNRGGTVDTGIALDSLPYVLLLGIVVLAGTRLLFKRRETEN